MFDPNMVDVRGLDEEGLAAVILVMLRERVDGTGTAIGHSSAWHHILSSYLAPRWYGYTVDPRSGCVTTPTEVHTGGQFTPPELMKRGVEAVPPLRGNPR